MIGLIILYFYLNSLWRNNFNSFLDRLSFSTLQSTAVLYPALDIGEKFSVVKSKAMAKFIWYIIFVITLFIIKSHTIDLILMLVYGIVFAPNEILAYIHLKKEIREISYYGEDIDEKSLKAAKNAYLALLLYQLYLFMELLVIWY